MNTETHDQRLTTGFRTQGTNDKPQPASPLKKQALQQRGASEAGSEADPFADPPAQAAGAAPADGAAADPYASPQANAFEAPAGETATAEQVAEAAEEQGIFGLFGSALTAVTSSGLLGPAVGLASIVYAAADADNPKGEEKDFVENPEVSGTRTEGLAVGSTDEQGNMSAISASDVDVRVGGSAKPIIAIDDLVVANSGLAPPEEVPVTVDVSEEAPIVNLNGGDVVSGDVMVNALQLAVSGQTLLTDVLVNPEQFSADSLKLEVTGLELGDQQLALPEGGSSGSDGSAGSPGGATGTPLDSIQAMVGGGADLMSQLPAPIGGATAGGDSPLPIPTP